jgi:hypothetical protein
MNKAKGLLVEAGLDKSHWGKRIIIAEELGGFTEEDCVKAAAWPTCACGRVDGGISRAPHGEPRDSRLSVLGGIFPIRVIGDRFREAAKCLIDIEHRAIQVLKEQQNNEGL